MPAWKSKAADADETEAQAGAGEAAFSAEGYGTRRTTDVVCGSPRTTFAGGHGPDSRRGDEAGERLKIHRSVMPDSVRSDEIRSTRKAPEAVRPLAFSFYGTCGAAYCGFAAGHLS